ncbi:hypothetical protein CAUPRSCDRAFT_12230 [Caulochytrium protostelioides]|uniref:Uncharacterized protein n=1 Tax=Caulochytrium protostelioides TaxID=1555241 RepID=A0A4P9WXB1_9FUNG|nr:hypothetical protein CAUPRSCDRAFT_12230 [Caulochytrium protostelioides]
MHAAGGDDDDDDDDAADGGGGGADAPSRARAPGRGRDGPVRIASTAAEGLEDRRLPCERAPPLPLVPRSVPGRVSASLSFSRLRRVRHDGRSGAVGRIIRRAVDRLAVEASAAAAAAVVVVAVAAAAAAAAAGASHPGRDRVPRRPRRCARQGPRPAADHPVNRAARAVPAPARLRVDPRPARVPALCPGRALEPRRGAARRLAHHDPCRSV